jgi:uncharacterized protein YbjT (DUF2867 family)
MQQLFITGGTGYIGSRLIKALQQKGGYRIKALVRKGSEHKLPPGCEVVTGNALDASTYAPAVAGTGVFIHMIGVSHPSPAKKEAFETIDLVSVQQAAVAVGANKVPHVIYISVSQYPGKLMKEYKEVRAKGESLLQQTGARCSFIRPWYVLGPDHWWPVLLLPFYAIARLFPSTREQSRQQGLVTIQQMINTLVFATVNPPKEGIEVYTVPDIKKY